MVRAGVAVLLEPMVPVSVPVAALMPFQPAASAAVLKSTLLAGASVK